MTAINMAVIEGYNESNESIENVLLTHIFIIDSFLRFNLCSMVVIFLRFLSDLVPKMVEVIVFHPLFPWAHP